jgi:hypothetical protein
MNDERLRDAYALGRPEGEVRPPLDDVAAERLRRLVDREGSDEERLHTVETWLTTPEGQRELAIVWAAARAARPRRRWSLSWGVAAALLVAAGVAGSAWWGDTGREVVRDDAAQPIALLGPVGPAAADRARRFAWRALPGADRYRLVVVDTTGADVFALDTRDTVLTLPDSVHLEAGRAYLWWVQAVMSDGATVTAVTRRFDVTR